MRLTTQLNRGVATPPPLVVPLATMISAAVASLMGGGKWKRRLLWLSIVVNVAFAALMRQATRAPVSPGANDDASGVAVVLALARALAEHPPPRLDVWFVTTGSEEGVLGGMQAFVSSHREELMERGAVVLNLEMRGSGRVVYYEGEGFLGRVSYRGAAIDAARQAAAELPDVSALRTAPYLSDALVATRAGIPAVTVASVSEDGHVPHYHWSSDLPEHVDVDCMMKAYKYCRLIIDRLSASDA